MVSLGVYFISSLPGSIENLFASGTYILFDGSGYFFRDEYMPGADALSVVPPTLSHQDGCLQEGNIFVNVTIVESPFLLLSQSVILSLTL